MQFKCVQMNLKLHKTINEINSVIKLVFRDNRKKVCLFFTFLWRQAEAENRSCSLASLDFDLHVLGLTTSRCKQPRACYVFMVTKAAIYTCVETLKFLLCCHTSRTPLFIFFSPSIACFTVNHAGPAAGFHSTFNRATFQGNFPQRFRLECWDKSMWNKRRPLNVKRWHRRPRSFASIHAALV